VALLRCLRLARAEKRRRNRTVDDASRKGALRCCKKEGGELTWYTAHSDDITAQALGRNFESLYPGIKVNVLRTTAQVAYQRITQENQGQRYSMRRLEFDGPWSLGRIESPRVRSKNIFRKTQARCWISTKVMIRTAITSSLPRA